MYTYDNDKTEKEIVSKLDFFLKEGCMVHVSLKDGSFMNCQIISKKNDGIYMIIEKKFGKKFLFVVDIYKVDSMNEFNTGAEEKQK